MNILGYLAASIYLPEDEISAFIKTAPYRYKRYSIPKRNGKGLRAIEQPTPELKTLQLLAIEKLKPLLPIHSSAMAYRDGLSIKQNATTHAKNSFLLKMDFKDFFHSLTPSDLIQHIEKYSTSLAEKDHKLISKLFFWTTKRNPALKLSIGAPSSPFISNTVMYDFDLVVTKLCSDQEITYTRYADDLTFTTNIKHVLFNIPAAIQSICNELKYPKLAINHEKTVFSSKKSNRHITGITITNDSKISLGRERKRYIRSLIFKFAQETLSQIETQHLKGLLSFSKHIEPSFYYSVIKKYGIETITKIQTAKNNVEQTP